MNERTILDLDGYLLQGIVRLAQNAQRKGNRYTQLISDLRAQYFARSMRATCRHFANALAPMLAPAFVYRMCHLHLCDSLSHDKSSRNDQIFANYMQLCAPIGANPDARQFARKWRYHILYAFITMPIECARVGERCARHWISEQNCVFSRDEMRDLIPHMVRAIEHSSTCRVSYQNRLINILACMSDAWSFDNARAFVLPMRDTQEDARSYGIIISIQEQLNAQYAPDDISQWGCVDQLLFLGRLEFGDIICAFEVIHMEFVKNGMQFINGEIALDIFLVNAARMLTRAPTVLRSYISSDLLIKMAQTCPTMLGHIIRTCDLNVFYPPLEQFRAYQHQQGHLYIPRIDIAHPLSFTNERDYRRLCEIRTVIMVRDNLELLRNISRATTYDHERMIDRLRNAPIPQFFANMLRENRDKLVSYIDPSTWNPNESSVPSYFTDPNVSDKLVAVLRLRIAIELQRISLCINGIREELPLFVLTDQDDRIATLEQVIVCALKHPKTDRHLALRYCRALGRSLVADISAQYHAIPYADYYLQQLTQPVQL